MSFADIWLFLQQGVLSGLVTGSVYALLAVAVVIIFKTTDVPNFAQGEIFMVGGYIALFLTLVMGWPYLAVIPVTLAVVAVVSGLFQRVVMERVIASRGVGVQMVIATLGLAYALKGLVRQTGLGDTPRSLPPLAPTAPNSVPAVSRITTAPVWGRNLPLAVAASETKKLGLSLARSASLRLDTPMPTAPHALARATSKRNMLAPSSLAKALRLPAASSTAMPMGW